MLRIRSEQCDSFGTIRGNASKFFSGRVDSKARVRKYGSLNNLEPRVYKRADSGEIPGYFFINRTPCASF